MLQKQNNMVNIILFENRDNVVDCKLLKFRKLECLNFGKVKTGERMQLSEFPSRIPSRECNDFQTFLALQYATAIILKFFFV